MPAKRSEKPKRYDYVFEAQHAALYVNQREAEQKMRKVLRKLVKAAVEECEYHSHGFENDYGNLADRIARELVPPPGKRGAK